MYRFKPLKNFYLILGFAFLETVLLPNLLPGGLRIELLLMLVIFMSLFFTEKQVLPAAVFCGLIKDMSTAQLFGVYMLLFFGTVFLIQRISRYFFKEIKLFFAFLVFFVSFLFLFAAVFLSRPVNPLDFSFIFTRTVLPTALISALVSPLVLSFLHLIFERKTVIIY